MTAVSTRTPSRPTEFAPDTPLGPLPRGWRSLPRGFLQQARRRREAAAVVDSTGTDLTYGDLLLRALVLSRVLARQLDESPYVGVLLPPTVPAVLVNLALAFRGKVAVNLNYTAGQENLDACLSECGITQVITSRTALKKMGVEPAASLLYIEDAPRQATKADKAWAFLVARAVPMPLLGLFLPGLRNESLDATAAVIFTSGSTGEPKGVLLTHGNVLSNAHQIEAHLKIHDDVILGVLPFFHSFGYTITIWMVLCLGQRAVYHFNPLDARIVGHLCEEHKVTIAVASPTFARAYLRKCDPAQFGSVRLFVLGAEKLKLDFAREIKEKLHLDPVEGYGCTETGPVVAASVPEPRVTPDGRTISGYRLGTVGMPVPGTAIKTIDPDTGADLPRGVEGLVLVKGPQVMKGYLNRPELTAKVLRDGWYTTGDLGHQDADGFLTITGRLSRFSKIGGEMVPHERVEAAILEAAESEHAQVAVTSVSDSKRGERLVVLYNDLSPAPAEIHRRLLAGTLPRLWIPAVEDFVPVESIPILGTGKVNLKQVRRIAEERAGDDRPAPGAAG
jgi:acyl-[acyl-carrier-protein]-phospholipid O-acyltransferase/long-chain-fatty-acid--[acyl-carrier-protein] ligase